MKESQEKVRKSVLIIGESLNMLDATEILLKNVGINSTIKELLYRSFINNYNEYFEKNDSVFEAIQIVRVYCNELSANGEVKFDVPYVYNSK